MSKAARIKQQHKHEVEQKQKQLSEMTAEEYIEYLRKNEVVDHTRPVNVREWNRQFSNNEIVANHEYQRKEGAWSLRMKKGLLFSLLNRRPIPPIVVTRNKDTFQREVVDGQHRLVAIRDFHNGKVPLPGWVPHHLGGGQTISHVDPQIVQYIDEAIINEMELTGRYGDLDTNQIKDIFNSLQKSVILTVGQEVRSRYGDYKTLVEELGKNPLSSRFGNKEDSHLQWGAYLLTYVYQTSQDKIPVFKKDVVLDLLDSISDEPCDDGIAQRCFMLQDLLKSTIEETKMNTFYAMSVIYAADELLNRGYPVDQVELELNHAFKSFWAHKQKIEFDDTSLDFNNEFTRALSKLNSHGVTITRSSKHLFMCRDLLLEVWENEGIPT